VSNVINMTNSSPTLRSELLSVNIGTDAAPVSALVIRQVYEDSGDVQSIVIPAADLTGLIDLMQKHIEVPT